MRRLMKRPCQHMGFPMSFFLATSRRQQRRQHEWTGRHKRQFGDFRRGSNPFGPGTSGVCKPLAAPTDGQINCGDFTIFYRCTAQCNSGYEFDNGDSTIQKDCDPMTGQFFSGPAFPKCIPTCSPACQNGGTCVQPNVCSCAPGWNGTFCESLDGGGPGSNPFGFGNLGACKPLAAPTDGQINCGDSTIFYQCTAQCNSGYEFDNGDSTIQKDCDPMTGQFFSGPAFPKCIRK
uniref:EGF-like domain-containing protein n=1 Tax=Magallana gigas TaxID=29159 RepID=A0A8W8MXH9_MAGGI